MVIDFGLLLKTSFPPAQAGANFPKKFTLQAKFCASLDSKNVPKGFLQIALSSTIDSGRGKNIILGASLVGHTNLCGKQDFLGIW